MILVLLLVLPSAAALLLAAWPGAERVARPVGLATTGAVLALTLVLLARFDYAHPARMQAGVDVSWIPAIGSRFHLGVDGISLPLVVLTALLSALCALYSLRHTPEPSRSRAFTGTLLALEVGMLGTFLALDLVLFFAFFEVVLIPMYFMIAVWGGPRRGPAATKFILFTLLGSALMLVGFLTLWASAGSLDMVTLAGRHGGGLSRTVQDLAFLAMLLGFGVKAPMWPLHTWLPDAHTEAPTVGSVLLAGVLLKMGTYGLVRIALPTVPEGAHDLAPALGVLAAVGIVYGALACLAQRDLKRLIAYSSVGHMGFVLLGIATLTATGVNAALFANVAHGLITGLLFFLVGSLKDRYHTVDIGQIGGGVQAKLPVLGGLVTFAAIASLGLPGLAGFWGEMLAMLGAFRPAAGLPRGLFLGLMAAAGAGTVLTVAYFTVMLRRVTLGPVAPARREAVLGDVTAVELAAWAPLVAAIVAVGLYPRLLLGVTDAAVRGLVGGG